MECCKNLNTKEFTKSSNSVWSLEFCIPNTSVAINKNAGKIKNTFLQIKKLFLLICPGHGSCSTMSWQMQDFSAINLPCS
jgi:hypothetical protein